MIKVIFVILEIYYANPAERNTSSDTEPETSDQLNWFNPERFHLV